MFVETMNQYEQFVEFMHEFDKNEEENLPNIYILNWSHESETYQSAMSRRGNKMERVNLYDDDYAFFTKILTKKGSKVFFRFPKFSKMLGYAAFLAMPKFLDQYRKATMRPCKSTMSQTFFKFIQINHDYTIVQGPTYRSKSGEELHDDVILCAEGTIRFSVIDGRFVVFTQFIKNHVR